MTNAMKASIKFRDEQKPLLRAKVPISILGLPFLSGVSAGETKELRLDLGTAFESGPLFRVSYRPNDPSTPFSLVVKTGVGSFGSPIQAPFAMSAEFNLIGPGAIGSSPRFSILIKPRFGDFVLKKSVQSNSVESVVKKIVIDHEKTVPDPSVSGVGKTAVGFYPFESVNGFTTDVAKSTNGFLSGMELNAGSVLPFFNRAKVNFRWGLRVPPELGQVNSGMSISKMPLLVMNKLSIEHVSGNAKEAEKKPSNDAGESRTNLDVKPEFDALKAESGMLRRAVEDLRAELIGLRANGIGSSFDDVSRNGAQTGMAERRDRRNTNGKVPEVSWSAGLEEVKKSEAKKPGAKGSEKK
ncbi:hypothetical protein LUZ61_000303 [Rhynchospora tenuis]|uniref:Uncharacterized protein n=1 Tax=Rhynchospora tenuis TaxID=198213 RepID=A0AAD6EPQ1_9POAL|nr:hypothetical protein LUZ61_000303 [Rhynchospora tenuis]